MLHHISLGTQNIEKAARFYDAILAPLGHVRVWSDLRPGGRGQAVGFTAATRSAVVILYNAALSAGAKDNGLPGLCPDYGDKYFAAFVIDPDGHRLEAVCNSSE